MIEAWYKCVGSSAQKARALVLFVAVSAPATAHAGSISNNDGESHTLIVTEEGVRVEMVIAPDETLTACEEGCFILAPNGDWVVLSGGESVTIANGVAIVQ